MLKRKNPKKRKPVMDRETAHDLATIKRRSKNAKYISFAQLLKRLGYPQEI